MRNYRDRYQLPPISLNTCRHTVRGDGRADPSKIWHVEWLLSRAFDFKFDEIPQFLICACGNNKEYLLNSESIRIFTTGENIQANFDEVDYALTHERIYNDRHWRVPLWRHWFALGHSKVEQDFDLVKSRVSRFCNFVYSNDRALERIEFFDKLHARKHVDSGGKVRNNIGGRVDDKHAFVQSSKFTIAFENESHPGYSTEKVIQPMLAGSIPIYWGDTTIEQDLNPNRMINVHSFASFDDAIEHVLEVDRDDKLWESYIREPVFRDDKVPDELSDEAILDFFHKIFTKPTHHVSPLTKKRQKLTKQYELSSLKKNVDRVRNKAARMLGK